MPSEHDACADFLFRWKMPKEYLRTAVLAITWAMAGQALDTSKVDGRTAAHAWPNLQCNSFRYTAM